MVALITPFHDDKWITRRLGAVEFQTAALTDRPVGITGESPTLGYEEHSFLPGCEMPTRETLQS
jgi:dihydrodipicolinate synthase/N-acetylneuraminate lyase